MFELKTGAVAQERAGDQRDFGNQMVTDHGKNMEELRGLEAQSLAAESDEQGTARERRAPEQTLW